MTTESAHRLRLLYVHPRMSVTGADARGCCAIAPGDSLVIGCVTGGLRVNGDGPVVLGGVRSYVVSADADGALTFQHTGHAGTMRVNDESVSVARLATNDVVDLVSPTGTIAMRFMVES